LSDYTECLTDYDESTYIQTLHYANPERIFKRILKQKLVRKKFLTFKPLKCTRYRGPLTLVLKVMNKNGKRSTQIMHNVNSKSKKLSFYLLDVGRTNDKHTSFNKIKKYLRDFDIDPILNSGHIYKIFKLLLYVPTGLNLGH
jgi:hypothetical protein